MVFSQRQLRAVAILKTEKTLGKRLGLLHALLDWIMRVLMSNEIASNYTVLATEWRPLFVSSSTLCPVPSRMYDDVPCCCPAIKVQPRMSLSTSNVKSAKCYDRGIFNCATIWPITTEVQWTNNNNNNNKLYLHDYIKVLQYCKSHLKIIVNYLID